VATSQRPASTVAPARTPDQRYIVVRGRLWRAANPGLTEARRKKLVAELMRARRAIGTSKAGTAARRKARAAVQAAKEALGERGRPWWKDGAPDFNRRLVRNTPYAGWWKRRNARQRTAKKRKAA
jgi:hypothetical protein